MFSWPYQRLGNLLSSSHSVGIPWIWLVGLTKTPMEIATSRLGGPKKPTLPMVISWVPDIFAGNRKSNHLNQSYKVSAVHYIAIIIKIREQRRVKFKYYERQSRLGVT